MIHSIAGELDLDVYVVSLAKKGLDDSDLSELMTELPKRCIALMEDIDVAFKGASKRAGTEGSITAEGDENGEGASSSEPKPGVPEVDSARGVTLSGLLNALDGIAAQEGRILFATTNHLSALDDALCRPGRMDVHIEFKNASRWQAKQIFKRFFPPISRQSKVEEVGAAKGDTKPKFSPRFGSGALSEEEVEELAERFADLIPERMFSVAALQGLLLCHKNKPREAVATTTAFVEERLNRVKAERLEREGAERAEKQRAEKREQEKKEKKEQEDKDKDKDKELKTEQAKQEDDNSSGNTSTVGNNEEEKK